MDKKINLKEMPTVTCESCGFDQFKEVTFIKRVSKELTGTDRDTKTDGQRHTLATH